MGRECRREGSSRAVVTDLDGRARGAREVGVGRLEGDQLLLERIVLGVGDLRSSLAVVELAVALDLLAQSLDALARLVLVHAHLRPAARGTTWPGAAQKLPSSETCSLAVSKSTSPGKPIARLM
jgi:hypothetical protein